MRTTATNKKIRVLLRALADGSLRPDPSFQRRLVWANRHKLAFLDTVLSGLPFPEIYIASGEVDPRTATGVELVVDGQQRLTTLRQYFEGSDELKHDASVMPYAQLPSDRQRDFLEYEVVVRDLGAVDIEEVRDVFRRINSTKYALNAMEIHNARFEGEFKQFGERIASHEFFETNRVFNASEIRRMKDVLFCLSYVCTIMSSYFNRDDEVETFLEKYDDEFPYKDKMSLEVESIFGFLWSCDMPRNSRAWKKSDLFTLMVEVHRAVVRDKLRLTPVLVAGELARFYEAVERGAAGADPSDNVRQYMVASIQATNDRSSRIRRGKAIQNVLRKSAGEQAIPFQE